MKAIERLFEYFDYKGIKPTAFEKKSGLSNGYLALTLKRKGDIGSKIVDSILEKCPDLSQKWLMLGEGEMLQEIKKEIADENNTNSTELEYYKSQLELTKELLKEKTKYIDMFQPLIDQMLKELVEKNNNKY